MIPWVKLKNDSNHKKLSHNFVKNEHNPWPMDSKK